MTRSANPYEQDLDKNPANYAPLTPLSFIERAASVYPEQVAVIHGELRRSWKEVYSRCRRLASALQRRRQATPSSLVGSRVARSLHASIAVAKPRSAASRRSQT